MRLIAAILLLAAAHFAGTAFVPAATGKAWFGWPFAADSKPVFGFVGGLPAQGGSVFTPFAGGVAVLCLLLAALALFWRGIPAAWWPMLVTVGAIASILLFVSYFERWAVLPIAIDAVLLWAVLAQRWSVTALRGF